MKKVIGILAVVVASIGVASAQNQVISTDTTNFTVTVKASDSNSTAVVVAAQDMSKIWGVRLVNTGSYQLTYAFGAKAAYTNAYATALTNGVPLAAGGSVTYSTATSGAVPAFPLSAKQTNTASGTLLIELLRRP